MNARAFKVYGLTGGIASGKSTVAQLFTELAGIPVVDADRLTRALSAEGGAAHPLLLKRFGTADRARLRELVFKDAEARRELEAILHPLIRTESERQLAEAAARSSTRTVLYEAALLVESGRHRDFDGLIVVQAPLDMRVRRLMARDQSDEEAARRIIAAQLSDEERAKAATYLIQNTGDLQELKAQVLLLIPRL